MNTESSSRGLMEIYKLHSQLADKVSQRRRALIDSMPACSLLSWHSLARFSDLAMAMGP